MGEVVQFKRQNETIKIDSPEQLLFELSQQGVVFDVDPDIVEAAGLIEETALTWQEAREADEEVANDDESGEANE
jgi:hypothetical protein